VRISRSREETEVPSAITDPWTDRLSERLDGSLSPEDAGLLDAHLVTCADCRGVLADLERVVVHARALPAIAPAEDLWPGIAARVASFAAAEEEPRTDAPPAGVVRARESPCRGRS
jgi:anti-sigma factor RsiW